MSMTMNSLYPAASLVPHPDNPRKNFDPVKLKELAASIEQEGVLQPILARKHPTEEGKLQIIAGERRWRAAQLAAVDLVPVVVRELTDQQAAEVMIVENLQRDDLGPIEEADAYALLTKRHNITTSELAARIGKSVSYVNKRMILCKLPEAAKKATAAGEMPLEVALAIARMPDAGQAAKAAKDVMHDLKHGRSARDVLWRLRRNYMLELGSAPWSLGDADLVPRAGACSVCPHSTKNAQDLFGDCGKDALCTLPSCWDEKLKAFAVRKKAEVEERGGRMATATERKALRPYGGHFNVNASPFVELDDRATYMSNSSAKWRGVLKDALAADPGLVIVDLDDDGRPRELIPRAKAMDLAREAGHKWAQRETRGGVGKSSAEKKRELEQRIDQRARALFAKAAYDAAAFGPGGTSGVPSLGAIGNAVFRITLDRLDSSKIGELCKALGIEVVKRKQSYGGMGKNPRADLEKHATEAAGNLVPVVYAMLAWHFWPGGFLGDKAAWNAVVEAVGEDVAALKRQARVELTPKDKPAAKKKGAKKPAKASAKRVAKGKATKTTKGEQ